MQDTFQYTQTMKQIGNITLCGLAISGSSLALEALSHEPRSAYDVNLPESSLETVGLFIGAGMIIAAAGAALYEKQKHQRRLA